MYNNYYNEIFLTLQDNNNNNHISRNIINMIINRIDNYDITNNTRGGNNGSDEYDGKQLQMCQGIRKIVYTRALARAK